MSENTAIPWAHHSFNPWWGCEQISPGCVNCYGARDSHRWGHDCWGPDVKRRTMSHAHWKNPIKWDRKAAQAGERHRVFLMSMGDIFEDRRELDGRRAKAFSLVEGCTHLDWLILTKRIENAERLVPHWWNDEGWPDNAWAMVTAENQRAADERIPLLLEVPARVRGVSYEPALGSIDFDEYLWADCPDCDGSGSLGRVVDPGLAYRQGSTGREASCELCGGSSDNLGDGRVRREGLDWIIVGSESGPGARRPPVDAHRSVRDQCIAAEVPFFLKQWPGATGELVKMPTLYGRVWAETP